MIDVVAVAVAIEARVEAIRNEGNDTAVSGRKTKRSVTEEETTRRGITSDLERIVSIITVEKTATREEIANGIDSCIQSKLKSRRLNLIIFYNGRGCNIFRFYSFTLQHG